ncbi:MAG: multiheme c-type cytochrome [Planctomycetaceae bacterium]|nr:hypothetical protein [Planctomycetaceae bacterium]
MAFRNWKLEFEDQRLPRVIPWAFIRGVAIAVAAVVAVAAAGLWVWPGWLLERPWQRSGPAPDRIALVFSSDIGGQLEPAGCTRRRWGGIARTAGYIQSVTDPPIVLAMDVGEMTAGPLAWQQQGWEHALRAMGAAGYRAANLGAREASLAVDDLRRVAAASPVPLISANVVDAATGSPVAPTHVSFEVSNLRVSVVGVVQNDPRAAPGAGLAIADPSRSLESLLPGLAARSDVLVLLAACDIETMRALASAHPQIDVILGGRVTAASRTIERVGACRLAYQADHGQLLGRMDVAIRDSGRPGDATAGVVLLDESVAEPADMLSLVEQYNAQLAAIAQKSGLAKLGLNSSTPAAAAGSYAGSEACRSCHAEAHAVWIASAHSRALASLTQRRRDSNPDCLRCHVLDAGAPQGYAGMESAALRGNVQCESCHGPANRHVANRNLGTGVSEADALLPKVSPQSCVSCHDCTRSPDFNFSVYWKKIQHGKNKTR